MAQSKSRTPAREPLADLPAFEPLVDAKAAARFLGVPVSWVYGAAADQRIPHRFVGRYLRFRLSELEEWLQPDGPEDGREGSSE